MLFRLLEILDAISFVQEYDHLDFRGALDKLRGKSSTEPGQTSTAEKPKPKRMTEAEWEAWGRSITPADVQQFAASRKDHTASFETWQDLGCRVKDGFIGFPYKYTDRDGQIIFDLIKKRSLTGKEFDAERQVASNGVFNLDCLCFGTFGEDVFVVEGEPDVATMKEAGFLAVSPINGAQKKFSQYVLDTLNCAGRIFLIGDQAVGDETAGPKCMDGLQKLLPIEKTYRIRFDDAKDVSELRRKSGNLATFQARLDDLIEDALKTWVSKNVPNVCDLSTAPIKWTVDRMFPYGGLSIICGKQGAMKSLSALFFADAITKTNGERSFLGRRILEKTPILYIDRENAEGEAGHRSKRIGISADQRISYWGDWMRHEPTPEPDDVRLFEFAEREKGLIVFDSLQDWYGDRNENDNSEMLPLMRQFQRLARTGAGVLILHHAPKYGEAGYRGATSITAIPEMSFTASKNDSGIIELREIRFRCTQSYEIDFRVNFGETLENESDGTPLFDPTYTLELLRDESTKVAIEKRNETKRSKRETDAAVTEQIVRLIEANNTTKPGQIAVEIGRENDHSGQEFVKYRAHRAGYEYASDGNGKRIWVALVKVDLSPDPADQTPDAREGVVSRCRASVH